MSSPPGSSGRRRWATGSALARGSVQNTEDLQAQIDTLTKQRDQLLVDNSRLADLDREVQQLRKQLDFQQAQPTYDIVAADVVKNDRESSAEGSDDQQRQR